MVIGGGLVGASIALAVSKYSRRRVMLIDKGSVGKGGTSAPSGILYFFHQFQAYLKD